MDYSNDGKVALWKNTTDNDKAPVAKGHIYAHRDYRKGERIELALWRNGNENPKAPAMTGKLSDPQPPKEAPVEDFDDDDIPF